MRRRLATFVNVRRRPSTLGNVFIYTFSPRVDSLRPTFLKVVSLHPTFLRVDTLRNTFEYYQSSYHPSICDLGLDLGIILDPELVGRCS